jgi:hypothetical protein
MRFGDAFASAPLRTGSHLRSGTWPMLPEHPIWQPAPELNASEEEVQI